MAGGHSAEEAMDILTLHRIHFVFMTYHPIAGMEGLFQSEKGAPLVVMGQPDLEAEMIDNPLAVNKVLSFLIYGTTVAEVQGLGDYGH
jgi:cytochrome bd ubiquinol oxidase subunit I